MGTNSRTYNSIRNGLIAILFYVINLLLQFVSRRVFIEHIGTDLLGLNATIVGFVQFINIAELGIGTAIACTLYRPINNNNTQQINEIVSLQGWLYRIIAFVILFVSAILLCFFPCIFAKSEVPISYAYLTFISLMFSVLLGYFVNYRQILLSATQQEYKIQLTYKLAMLMKVVAQIVAVIYLNKGYIWWMALEVVFACIAAIALNISIKKSFPLLKKSPIKGNTLRKKYPEVTQKVYQLFFHKIATFVLSQLAPIVIYTYASLTLVAKYSNYMLVVTGVISLLTAMFNGLNAGVGNLVAEGDSKRILCVFRELFSMRFVFVSVCTILLFTMMEPFVSLWIGPEFILDKSTLWYIVAIFYLTAMRGIVDSFLHAYGLFGDIWAPITEASLNIGLSFLLGYYMGLNGVLLGVIISLVAIVFIWKPYFLFSCGLKRSIWIYVKLYTKHLFVLTISVIMLYYLRSNLCVNEVDSFVSFIKSSVIIALFSVITIGGLLYVTESGLRDFIKRMHRTFKLR